ncbi:MAG: DUF3341 domain-containing protein [Nannocystis sp.]|nr:hypothetical protein [Nannocystis sp.]MBA3548327.1 DUF3341 domain-containing protein [Nannocystis sp.]
MKKAIVCTIDTRAQAEEIIRELTAIGFGTNDISVLMSDSTGTKEFAHENHTKAPEGAAGGAAAGGVLGGTLGLLMGLGMLAIPGLGAFIAAGPIMAALGGAAAGATAGGITGALVGLGIPEIEAKVYEGRLNSGNLLMSVHTDNADERQRAEELLKRLGAQHITSTTEAAVPRDAR